MSEFRINTLRHTRVRHTGNPNKGSWKIHPMSGFLGQDQHYDHIPAISGCGQYPYGQLSSDTGFRQYAAW
jgi:hypothetical protein